MDSILDLIKSRRSVRRYNDNIVKDEDIDAILEAGRWAPSGLNNQPWRFAVVRKEETKKQIASFTKYSATVLGAKVIIAVFLDTSVMYDRTKDVQAIGAAIQNMLLETHARGLGACWIGQILAERHNVEKTLGAAENLELMAIITIGYPATASQVSRREPLEELVFVRESLD